MKNIINKLISEQWFDWVDNFYHGFAKVKLDGKRNLINTEGKLISEEWFDNITL